MRMTDLLTDVLTNTNNAASLVAWISQAIYDNNVARIEWEQHVWQEIHIASTLSFDQDALSGLSLPRLPFWYPPSPWQPFSWRFMLLLTLNVLPHPGIWHFHGFSPVWE